MLNQGRNKWTFKGHVKITNENQYRNIVKEQERRRIQEFDHDDNKTLYQAYCMRTASLY